MMLKVGLFLIKIWLLKKRKFAQMAQDMMTTENQDKINAEL